MAMQLRAVTPEVSAFEQARARWERVARERRELKERLAGAKAALGFAENPPSKGDVVSPRLVDRIAAGWRPKGWVAGLEATARVRSR